MSRTATAHRRMADEIGLGNLALGHRPLVNEPLSVDDWREVYDALRAFQHHMRLIVFRARERKALAQGQGTEARRE